MEEPRKHNGLLPDEELEKAVGGTNVSVLGDAPAIAMGNLYQATAQALANAAYNAVNLQQSNPISQTSPNL